MSVFASLLLYSTFAGSQGWTVVASHPVPEGASGLAFDGTSLYCGIYGVDGGHVYQIDPQDGSFSLAFIGAHEDAFGLTFDGAFLWTTDHAGGSSTPAQAYQLDWNGNVIDSVDLPDHYMSGIAWDDGAIWTSRYYPDPGHLYRTDLSGKVLAEFDGPDDQPWDLAMHGDTVWIADYWGDRLYQLDAATGGVLDDHASEGVDPAGIVWDGAHLWYIDNGTNYDFDILYKVDLLGGGTPAIDIPDAAHDFGNTTIGTTVTWDININNTGDATLTVSQVDVTSVDLSCTTSLPISIAPGQSAHLGIDYAPGDFGSMQAKALVHSNDPVQTVAVLDISGHGIHAGPAMYIEDDGHFFADVRLGASTSWLINIANHGDQPLTVKGVESDHAAFVVDADTPLVLDTLQTASIPVWFTPSGTPNSFATVALHTTDPLGPAIVTLGGNAVDQDWTIGAELWEVQYTDGWDTTPKAMAPIDDVNGDGFVDLIVCTEDYMVRCLHGNASGHADELWAHEIYSGPVYSGKGLDITSDIDGDGVPEVVVGVTGGARLIRMLSGRTGVALWTYDTHAVGNGGWVYQVDASRDFDGDGVRDVLACAGDDGDDAGPKRAYCLNGLDGAVIWQRPLGGPVFAIIAVEDFTGDGVPDAVAGASDAWEVQGVAYGLDGVTGEVDWSLETTGSSVWALAALGDVSGDGVAEVMIGDFSSGQVVAVNPVYGDAEYVTGVGSFLTGFQVLQDVTGDAQPDIVPEYFGSTVRVLSGRTGEVVWSVPVVDNPTVAAAIDDVSGDGANDLVVGTLFSDNYVYVFDGVSGAVLFSGNFGTAVDSIAAMPDVVGDGSWELVVGGRDGTVSCMSGGLDALVFDPADVNQDGVVGVEDLLLVIGAWGTDDAAADVNGDGVVGVQDVLDVISAWDV